MPAEVRPEPARGLGALVCGPGTIAILFWGASFVATKRALEGFEPFALVALRFAIGAAFVASVQLARGRELLPERADLARCVLLGLVLALHIGVQAFALLHTSALHSGWLVALSPVAIAIGAALFLGERVSARAWAGIAIATAGALLVVFSRGLALDEASTADLAVLGTCLTWAAYTLLGRTPVARSGAFRVTPLVMGIAALVSGGFAFASTARTPEATSTASVVALLVLGLGASGIAFTAWAAAVDRLGATRAGALLYFQPFVTLALSITLLDEPWSWLALAGGPLVLAGVALVGRR